MGASIAAARPSPPSVRGSGVRPVERLCHATGVFLALSGLLHLVVFFVDGGPWFGPVSWRKPVTFGLSFGLTLIAVTWVTSYLRVGARLRTETERRILQLSFRSCNASRGDNFDHVRSGSRQ